MDVHLDDDGGDNQDDPDSESAHVQQRKRKTGAQLRAVRKPELFVGVSLFWCQPCARVCMSVCVYKQDHIITEFSGRLHTAPANRALVTQRESTSNAVQFARALQQCYVS